MSIGMRTFIAGIFLSLTGIFLYPSYVYYVQTPAGIRELGEDATEIGSNRRQSLNETEQNALKKAEKYRSSAVNMGLDIRGGVSLTLELEVQSLEKKLSTQEKEELLEDTIFRIQSRINEFGLADIALRKIGETQISLQIPGLKDLDRFVRLLESQGQLDFSLLLREETEELQQSDPNLKKIFSGTNILQNKNHRLVRFWKSKQEGPFAIVQTEKIVSGEEVEEASVQAGEFGEIVVSFKLSGKGAQKFGEFTGKNIGKELAIVFDNKRILSAPVIREKIPTGSVQISGNFTHEEARDLALVLRSGSLKVPISVISKEVVGPSLGKELLREGVQSLFLGLLLVGVVMVLRYRLSGLIACITLLINGLMVFAILAQLHFSVTLAGIVGLILTMGMSIDANVIIFERIREEWHKKKENLLLSVHLGFERAFWPIFDANITTLLVALILSKIGDGAIEGFAFTLFIGIVCSMFTALFLTRLVFDYILSFSIFRRWYFLFL